MTMRPGWLLVIPLVVAFAGSAAAAPGRWGTGDGTTWNPRSATPQQTHAGKVAQPAPPKIFHTGTARLGSFESTPIRRSVVTRAGVRKVVVHAGRTRGALVNVRPSHRLGNAVLVFGLPKARQ